MALTAGPSQEDRAAEAKANYDACESGVGEMIDATRAIDSGVQVVTVTLTNYQDLVSEASIADGVVSSAALDPACNDVYVAARSALDLYVSAEEEWSTCNDDYYCDLESDTEIRSKWSDAMDLIAEANAGLEAIRQPASGGG